MFTFGIVVADRTAAPKTPVRPERIVATRTREGCIVFDIGIWELGIGRGLLMEYLAELGRSHLSCSGGGITWTILL